MQQRNILKNWFEKLKADNEILSCFYPSSWASSASTRRGIMLLGGPRHGPSVNEPGRLSDGSTVQSAAQGMTRLALMRQTAARPRRWEFVFIHPLLCVSHL